MAERQSSTAERLMALFAGHAGAHGTHGEPEREGVKWSIKKTAVSLRRPVTLALWESHLSGQRPLGIITIREDNSCLWGCVDVDRYDVNPLDVASRVERAGLPLVTARSKSGGLHLFMFLREPAPAADVQAALRDMAAGLGLAGSEIFPKQTRVLSDRGDLGNWMVMPYFGGTFGGKLREQVGLRKTGAEMTAEEFTKTAEAARLTPAAFRALSDRPHASVRAPAATGATPAGGTRGKSGGGARAGEPVAATGEYSDGPPCLQHLTREGIPENVGRNNALFHMGVYYKKASPGSWQELLETANRDHLRPPLAAEEVTSIVRSLEKKDYEYKCRDEPMVSHCDSALCRARKFGVGEGGSFPMISSVSRLNTEPPIWFVDVEDARIECSTEDLQQYARFHRLCMERCGKCFRSMKQDVWLTMVGQAMTGMVAIEAPPDVGLSGRFRELVEDFCTDRATAERREDILTGRPWRDAENGRYVFRLRDLQKFFLQENVRDMTRGQMTRRIEQMGGGHAFLNLSGRGTNVWWVPEDSVERVGELPTPAIRGEPI